MYIYIYISPGGPGFVGWAFSQPPPVVVEEQPGALRGSSPPIACRAGSHQPRNGSGLAGLSKRSTWEADM